MESHHVDPNTTPRNTSLALKSQVDVNNYKLADLIVEIVNAIKDDDIYRYMNAFPLAEQRSFALST
jgi:hypothetical protein